MNSEKACYEIRDMCHDVLKDVRYKPGWGYRLGIETSGSAGVSAGYVYLQVSFPSTCSETGEKKQFRARKWILSIHMTKSEFVQTYFKAILTAEEHEAREHFKYKGESVFNPHFHIERLYQLCEDKRFDPREEKFK